MEYICFYKRDDEIITNFTTNDLEVAKKWYKADDRNFYCNEIDFHRMYKE